MLGSCMTLVEGMLRCGCKVRYAECARQGEVCAPQLATLEALGVRQVLDVEGSVDIVMGVRIVHTAVQNT